jgi:TonB-linked SusC/RagA family outer membrane protein
MKLLGRGCWRRHLPAKLLLVMRITSAILLISALHVSATGIGQTVSYSGKNVPLEQVFTAIKQQTGYVFFYKLPDLEGAKPVTVDFKNVPLEAALQKILQNQSLSFSIQGNTIFITLKTPTTVLQSVDSLPPHPAKTVKVHGTVLNESGQPLAGANITVKKSGHGTTTNAKGEFELSNVPVNGVLIISFVGYAAQEIKVKDDIFQQIHLKPASNELDKVVIQAYGTTTQRLTTSDIATVTSAEIERQPVMNPLLALEGKVAGLDVNQINGYASAPIKVELRGRSGISGSFPSDPLYIIDGVPLTIVDLAGWSSYANGSSGFMQGANVGPAGGQSPLFNVNPGDIESIEVLKDADALAIYGSRGANGVILITTKKGKPGKTHLDMHVEEGITGVTRYYNTLNTQEYVQMREQAFNNNDAQMNATNAYDLLLWDTTKNTNWQKVLYGGLGKTVNAQAAISGGNAQTTFRIGTSYNRTTNILTVSGADQRAAVSLNIGNRSLDQKFTLSLQAGYSFTQSNMVSIPGSGAILPPDAPPIYDSQGNLNFAGWGGNTNNLAARGAYPFQSLFNPYTAKTNFLNGSLDINYQILKGLTIGSNFGYNMALADQITLTTIASQDPNNDPTGSNNSESSTNKNWIIEPKISYETVIGKGTLNILLGGSAQHTNTSGLYILASGYTSDNLIQNITNAPAPQDIYNYGEYSYAAVFGRINYNWDNKYIINLNFRRDGSSRFASDKQFGDFGSVGAAWILTEEKWFKNVFPSGISFLKLRGSYGITGSDNIGDYGYLSRYTSNNLTYNGYSVLTPSQAPNVDYQWQVNKKLEGAINLGLFKDRGNLQISFYQNRCGNQLVSFPTPAFTGFGSSIANSPALVQNLGWEFTASSKLIETKQFAWSINFNVAINRNKLVSYPNFNLSPYVSTLIIGQPLNIYRVLHLTGVDPQTGQYTYQDVNHDGTITWNPGQIPDDSHPVTYVPKFFGGAGMNFSYKNLTLFLFFNYKKQIGTNGLVTTFVPGLLGYNQPTSVLARWQKAGDITSVARYTQQFTQTDTDLQLSDGIYTDASFIRLSNVSLRYTVPSARLTKIGIQGCSFYVNANNIFVITKYKGLDPETQNFGGMPPAKIIIGGMIINF